jgi:hypothetical protein
VPEIEIFRTVAYFMLETGSMDEAIGIFRRVKELAPGEPQSFLVWGEGEGRGRERKGEEERKGEGGRKGDVGRGRER